MVAGRNIRNVMGNNIKKLIQEVLEEGYLMSLGTYDDGGVWVADVGYVHDGWNIYWKSNPEARHSRAILRNPNVAGTITASNKGEKSFGVQFVGIAEKIEGSNYDLAKKYYAKKNKPEPKESDDVLRGNSWYVLKLVKIELLHGELFGYEKKILEL